MKNKLIHQTSEYDCGPTTLMNAIRFLYEREEIKPALIKGIWTVGNDTFGDDGATGTHGTSLAGMRYFVSWLNEFARGWKFPIHADFYAGDEVNLAKDKPVIQCLKNGGAALVFCFSGGYGHYVLLTSLEGDDAVGLFDPYDEEIQDFEGVTVVHDQPKRLNRIVKMAVMESLEKKDYAMGPYPRRTAVLITRTK